MTYSYEVWEAYIMNPKMVYKDGDHSNVYDKKCYDKCDLRFCKILLSTHRQATNSQG